MAIPDKNQKRRAESSMKQSSKRLPIKKEITIKKVAEK
jgi:hypothetical protein